MHARKLLLLLLLSPPKQKRLMLCYDASSTQATADTTIISDKPPPPLPLLVLLVLCSGLRGAVVLLGRGVALHPAAALLLVKIRVESARAVVGQCLGVAGLGRAEVGAAEGDVALSRQLVQQ